MIVSQGGIRRQALACPKLASANRPLRPLYESLLRFQAPRGTRRLGPDSEALIQADDTRRKNITLTT